MNRLVGRCVLRLQQYELQLKSILAHHDISGPVQDLESGRDARLTATSRQTLGSLIKALVGSVLVSGEPAAVEEREAEDETGPPTFRMTVRLGLTEAELSRTELDLRELVQIRNDLIHHFMERHDLWSLDGCRIALEELDATCDRIGADLARLQEWAADLEQVLHDVWEYVQSDAYEDAVVSGIDPDGTVFWPGAGIVAALREAALALSVDGWTEILAAKRWIADRYPDQTPEKYGCTTYPQVLHVSGEFDLCRLEKNGLPRRHYRLRDDALRKGGGQIAHPTTPPDIKA
ncbi:MAG: hypothetical protein Q8M85_03735 [Tabrizicola sp.]|nr:hypothetical protein [Tabrizicola sp.]